MLYFPSDTKFVSAFTETLSLGANDAVAASSFFNKVFDFTNSSLYFSFVASLTFSLLIPCSKFAILDCVCILKFEYFWKASASEVAEPSGIFFLISPKSKLLGLPV